ncbi:MAG: AzlD family protein [Woeseiaceae bacterium]
MVGETAAIALIGGMAVVTYLSRVGGLWAMRYVPMTPRVEAGLKALSGSILVALVVPAAIDGGPEFVAAVLTAVLLTVLTRRPLVAMASGVAVAGVIRALMSTPY